MCLLPRFPDGWLRIRAVLQSVPRRKFLQFRLLLVSSSLGSIPTYTFQSACQRDVRGCRVPEDVRVRTVPEEFLPRSFLSSGYGETSLPREAFRGGQRGSTICCVSSERVRRPPSNESGGPWATWRADLEVLPRRTIWGVVARGAKLRGCVQRFLIPSSLYRVLCAALSFRSN